MKVASCPRHFASTLDEQPDGTMVCRKRRETYEFTDSGDLKERYTHWDQRYRAVGTPGKEEYRCVDHDVLVGGDHAFSRLSHEEAYHSKEGLLHA